MNNKIVTNRRSKSCKTSKSDSISTKTSERGRSKGNKNKSKNKDNISKVKHDSVIKKEVLTTTSEKEAIETITTPTSVDSNSVDGNIDNKQLPCNNINKEDSSTNFRQLLEEDIEQRINEFGEKEYKLVITGEELITRKLNNIPCLIDPIFQQIGLAAIAGSSDTGKSSLLRDLAVSICSKQEEYLDWKIYAKHNSVIYVSTEDDQQSIAYLLGKQNTEKRLSENSYSSLRYIFDTTNLLENLNQELLKMPADLVIIDAFSDLFNGNLNDSNQVRYFLNQYNQLAQIHKCLIIFLHHTGKRTDDSTPSKHNLLGSQGFEAKMRVVVELRTDKRDSSKKHFCIVKGNYLTNEQKRESYVLQFSENMTFHSTGERVPLDYLKSNNEQETKIRQALELQEQGMSFQEIANAMGYANKSSVSRLLNKSLDSKISEITTATTTDNSIK